MQRVNLPLLVWLFLITSLALHDSTRFVDSQTTSCTWPQSSDLPLQPVTTLTGLNCNIFNLTTLFPSSGKSLIISDSIITNTVIFPSSFSLQNASIKFINTKLRVIRQRDSRHMLLLSGASLEFHNCTVIPPNEHQPAWWNSSGCFTVYYDPEYYSQGLQLMIAQNSSEYDIIIKGCTYRFVSEDKSFLLNASWMPYGFGIKIQTTFNDSMFNYSFRNIQIVDNHFETNHGAMDFFLLQFNVGPGEDKRQLTGNIINISGNTVVIRQIEGDDLNLNRGWYNAVLGPQVFATLQLRNMFLDDNNIDIRGVTLKSNSALVVFMQEAGRENIFFGMKQLSICRNKVVMSPTFSYGLYRGLNSSGEPAFHVNELRFLSLSGLNRVDEIIINNNDVFITTSIVYGFYLHFKTNPPIFTNGKTPIAATSTRNIGNVKISRNKVECKDTLRTVIIRMYCTDLCEHFDSLLISHNNISAFVDQRNSNFTSFLYRDFRGILYRGVSFGGENAVETMRSVRRKSTIYNTIHLEGMPQPQGVTNYIDLQDCNFVEYSFNNITVIQDDKADRKVEISNALSTSEALFGYGLLISQNVLRISKLEIQQNNILVVSKAGTEIMGIEVTSHFDFRLRPPSQTDPAIVPCEFKNRPELVYKNASIWNNTVRMLAIGSQSKGRLQAPIHVGCRDSCVDVGYFYVFNNTVAALTNQPSPAAGTNGITATTSGYSRNVSAVIISNNKIRISGMSGSTGAISFQVANGIDASDVMLGKVYSRDCDSRNFKKILVENNDIQVSNLKGTAAAMNLIGAGISQMENLELRNNTVLLTSKSLTEFFGSDPVFAPYSSFAGIDTSKLPSFPQDQHSYFYAFCPYGKALGFINVMTKYGLAVSVGKMTIENEKITLEKSGSFFSTRLGFYITDSLNVRNINMKSLGIADSSFRSSVVSSIFNVDSSSLGFQGLEYFSSVFPRLAKISISNSIFSIQLPSSCGDILNSKDESIINNQLSFINILPAPSTTVATTIVGDLIIQNVSFTQDCSASSNMPASTSSSNNIINIPKAVTANTHTSVDVIDLNIFSLPNTNAFMSHCNGNIVSSTSTSSSSTSATTSASIASTSWNGKLMTREELNSAEADFVSDSSPPRAKCQQAIVTPTKTSSRSDTSAELFSPSTTKSRSLIVNITYNNTRTSFFSKSLTSTVSTATMISGFVAASSSSAGLAVRTRTILSGVESIMMNDCGRAFTEEIFETPPPISASPTQFYVSGPKNGGYATGLILGDFFFLLLVVGGWFGCFAVIEKYVKPFVSSKMKSKKIENNNHVEPIFSSSFAAKSKVMIPAFNFGLMFLDPMFNSSIALIFIKEVGMGWKIIGVVISILLLLIGFFFFFVIYKLLVKRTKIEKFHKFDRFEQKTSKNPCGKVWYFFMGDEGEWMCPKIGKLIQINNINNKHNKNEKNNNKKIKSSSNDDDNENTIVVTKNDEALFRLAEPVIDGFTNRFPRFAIVEILTILSLAFALVIGHATANCTVMGVLLLFPVVVHLSLVIYYRPDKVLMLRIFIPILDVVQLMSVGFALLGDEAAVIILGTVLVTIQMLLCILLAVSMMVNLIDLLKRLGILSCTREKERKSLQSSHLDHLLSDFWSRNSSQRHQRQHHYQRDRSFSHSSRHQYSVENRIPPNDSRRPRYEVRDVVSSRKRGNSLSPQQRFTLSSFYFTTTISPSRKEKHQNTMSVVETAAKDLNDPRYRNL